MITEFPEKKCHVCGGDDWWYRDHEWVCGACHPSTDPTVRLKFRVIKGNHKLNIVLGKLKVLQGEELHQVLVKFHAAREKLQGLCNELKILGATECLYVEDGKKVRSCLQEPNFRCEVCPNSYWWEKEMMDQDKKDHPEVWKDV